jgi:hypothetical protein
VIQSHFRQIKAKKLAYQASGGPSFCHVPLATLARGCHAELLWVWGFSPGWGWGYQGGEARMAQAGCEHEGSLWQRLTSERVLALPPTSQKNEAISHFISQ